MKKIIILILLSLLVFTACEIKFDSGSATIIDDGSNAVTEFYFSKDNNLQFGLEEDVVGRFNGRQIFLTLPFGIVPSTFVPTIKLSDGICSMQSGREYDFNKEIQPVEFSVSRDNGLIELYVVYVQEASVTAKKITSFRFKETDAEIKILGNNIDVLVSGGTNLFLTPIIEHDGYSISPGSGEIIDFSGSYNDPIEYTVTAYDGSTAKYYVTVTDRSASSKEITSFKIDEFPEAQVTISGLDILVGVPEGVFEGTGFMLTPIIEINGVSIDPSSGESQNFSDDVFYTVYAEDDSSQTYSVLVKEIPSSNKEITGFEFRVEDNPSLCNSTCDCETENCDVLGDITGTNILVKVPYGTDARSLVPRIEYPESQGAKIMPASGIAQNFENTDEDPFMYTVVAADESFAEYLVTVEIDEDSKPSSAKEITALSVEIGGKIYNAKVSPNNSFITVYVPARTELSDCTVNIDHSDDAILEPADGGGFDLSTPVSFSITAVDNTVKYYTVVAKEIGIKSFAFEKSKNRNEGLALDYYGVVNGETIEFTLPYDEKIDNLKPTIEFDGNTVVPDVESATNFSYPVTYIINAENNTVEITDDFERNYEVNVYREQAITYFAFNKHENEMANLQTDVIGEIGPGLDESGRTIINLRVPYDAIVENLVPEIRFIGKAIDPLSGEPQDFSNPVEYTLSAGRSRTILRKSYSVIVTKELNYARDIKSFIFTEELNPHVPRIQEKKYIKANIFSREITVTMPYGTDITSLRPEIIISDDATVFPGSGDSMDFSEPVVYTVTAEDGSMREYIVTVDIALNHAKEIMQFSFLKDLNSIYLSEDIVLTQEDINEDTSEIIVEVPIAYGTSPMMLVPKIEISGASISPESGTKQDFSEDGGVVYTVTAENGTIRNYVVKTISTAREITSFAFTIENNENPNWTEDAVGEIIGNQINIPVPVSMDLSSLVATFEHTGVKITLGDNPEMDQVSGETPNDYRSSVVYRVTSENGLSNYYTVKIVDPRSWGLPQVIDGNTGNIGAPQISMDQSGNAIVLWPQYDESKYSIYSNSYVNGKWRIVQKISSENGRSASFPYVTMNQSGNAIAVWLQIDENRNNNIWTRRYARGKWRIAEMIGSAAIGRVHQPQVAIDQSGNAIAVWLLSVKDENNNWARRYANSSWGITESIDNGNVGNGSSSQKIAMNESGNAIVVWQQFDGTRYDIWSNSYVNGLWGTSELIGNDNLGNALSPQIAMNESGNAIVVWQQLDGTRYNIWSNSYVNGLWGTSELIGNDNFGNVYSPQIAMNQSGNAIAVWTQFDGTRNNVWSNRYMNGSWGTAELVENNNTGNAQLPIIAIDQSGNALAVWQQYGEDQSSTIWSNRYVNGTWGVAELINNDTGKYASNPQIVIDQSGNAIAVWSQSNGNVSNIYVNHLK